MRPISSTLKAIGSMDIVKPTQGVAVLTALTLWLSGCSLSKAPEPAPLAANVPLIGVKQVWAHRMGAAPAGAGLTALGQTVWVAAADGTVAALDAASGQALWRSSAGAPLSSSVGTDGKFAAVLTKTNEIVMFEAGRLLWRARLPAQGLTTPFVGGSRVFVALADQSVHAFDAANGKKLWSQQRPNEPLVLSKPGLLIAVGDTLLAGLGGRLVGMNPGNGSVRWEVPIASPRGTNDVERLVDLVGPAKRAGDVVCARAFQAAIACVQAANGTLLWSKPANGSEGLHGDETRLFGTESNGKIFAWRTSDGQEAWQSDRLRYRTLSAPFVVGRSVVVGDSNGNLHLLSREDGSPLNRLTTDGSAIVGRPVLAADSLVVLTQSGGVFGFRPE
jgi:outer membrane protein assembly factor BamB